MFWCHISARMMQDSRSTSDHISATTYMMCCEEHLCSISVLQRVRLSNAVNGIMFIRVGINNMFLLSFIMKCNIIQTTFVGAMYHSVKMVKRYLTDVIS